MKLTAYEQDMLDGKYGRFKQVALENVFLGQIDSSGDLYVDLFDDMIQVPKTQVKEMLYATIQKI